MTRGLLLVIVLLLLAASLVQGAPCSGGKNAPCDATRCSQASRTQTTKNCNCRDEGCGKGCSRNVCDQCHDYYTYSCDSRPGYDSGGNDCAAGKYNDSWNRNCVGCASGKYISTVSYSGPLLDRCWTSRGLSSPVEPRMDSHHHSKNVFIVTFFGLHAL